MLNKIKKLLRDFQQAVTYNYNVYTDYAIYSTESILLLEFLFENYDEKIKYSYFSSSQIANNIGSDEFSVARILRTLSKFCLVVVVYEETRQKIYLNPTIHACLTYVDYTRNLNTLVKHYVSMGINRSEHERPLQGFRSDIPYGHMEVEGGEVIKADQEVTRIVARHDEKKAVQEEDRQKWRVLGSDFVDGASKVWRMAQSAVGNTTDIPIWATDLSTIPPTGRKERNELIKIFQTYGGRVTALAWCIFCGGLTELDQFGKPVFDIKAPHRQWVSWDKKPSQFSKHFNSVLKDPETVNWAKTKWKNLYPVLKKLFGDCMETSPKMGDDLILSGLEFEEIN